MGGEGGGYAKFVALFEIMIIWLVGWLVGQKKERRKGLFPCVIFLQFGGGGAGGKAEEEEYACVFVCAELRSLAFLVE